MADITLAEFNGSVWLVGGEAYLDDLLVNALPPGISIEFVTCERKSDVHALWHRFGDPGLAVDPWLIHPAIAERFRAPPSEFAVIFAPWIVMPDASGLQMIARAASSAAADPEVSLVLHAHAGPDDGAASSELQSLRLRLIEEALERADVPRARITRAEHPSALAAPQPQGGGRVDILIAPAPKN